MGIVIVIGILIFYHIRMHVAIRYSYLMLQEGSLIAMEIMVDEYDEDVNDDGCEWGDVMDAVRHHTFGRKFWSLTRYGWTIAEIVAEYSKYRVVREAEDICSK